MAPSGDKLPETRVACSSGGSVKDRPEILMLGIHFVMSIWSWYSLLLSLKVKVKWLKLSWCAIHANLYPLFLWDVWMKLSSGVIIRGCGMVWFVPIHAHWGITRDTRKYKFTNRLNTTNETNLVWRDSHNIDDKVIVIYHVMSKIVIVLEK